MKVRLGFVSNSSSSSFTIPRDKLTSVQVDLIENHIEAARTIPYLHECACPQDSLNFAWDIFADDEEVRGSVDMDNFDMGKFLELIGVPDEHIIWVD